MAIEKVEMTKITCDKCNEQLESGDVAAWISQEEAETEAREQGWELASKVTCDLCLEERRLGFIKDDEDE